MISRSFTAMGTTVELLVDAVDAGRELDEVEREFERLEQTMSRFRPDSELSRLNRDGHIDASPDLARVVELALAARQATGGRFDPTVHDALVGAGYDRTFAEVPADTGDAPAHALCGGRIELDGSRISLAPGVRIDLGGIGKGYAAERAAEVLAHAGPCLVSAGGDVAVRGVPAESGVWPVGLEEGPVLGLARGGLATSGRDRRHWRRGGHEQHHLIDPATGRPAVTDIVRLTVVAEDAVAAEVLATSLFLAGSAEVLATDVAAVTVTDDGRTHVSGGLS